MGRRALPAPQSVFRHGRDGLFFNHRPQACCSVSMLTDRFFNRNRNRFDRIDDAIRVLTEGNIKLMSQVTDWAAQEQADLTAISATLDGIVTGVAALDTLITNFQNSPGTLSPSDQAALDAIQSASKAVVAKAAAISTVAPVPAA